MARKTSLTEEIYDLMKEEKFTKVVCGLLSKSATTIEQCKVKYAALMEEQWVDTSKTLTPEGDIKGNSVYDIFGRMYKMPGSDVKWDVVDWMCDNRRELAANFSIPFKQQDLSITSWMQRVEKDKSTVDEFVLYCLGRMYNKHVVVLTNYEPWSTLSRQFQLALPDVYEKSHVRLIYLGPGKYAEIRPNRETATPLVSPDELSKPPSPKTKKGKSTEKSIKRKRTKTTCRTSTVKRPKRDTTMTHAQIRLGSSLQAARDQKFGLNTSRPVRENRRIINYAKLNDGVQDEEDRPTPKRRKRANLPSRSGPSVDRIAASVRHPQSTVTPLHSPPPVSRVTERPLTATHIAENSRLTGVTKVLSVTPLSATGRQIGVTVTPKSPTSTIDQRTPSPEKLPDIVVNIAHTTTSTSTNSVPSDGVLLGEPALNSTKSTETSTQLNSQTTTDNIVIETEAAIENIPQDPQTTEDEDDAIDALLSLGSDLSQNISADDPLNENALLMPIGAPTIQDINPVEVKLDQVNVDNAIANVIEQEQLLETSTQSPSQTEQVSPVDTENDKLADSDGTIPAEDEVEESTDANQNNTGDKPPPTPKKGTVEIKEYGVKRKVSDGKLKFKCPKCGKRTKTRKQQNQHYKDRHDPIMCSNCDKVFNNPASLSVHMYNHMEHRFKCDNCEQGFHFAGQLTQHKAVHRKEGKGTFQCMTSNCGKWFIRKGDLVVHIETHKKKEWKCPHCDHVTTCEKYLKTHIKSRHETEENDYPYKCAVCNRRFLYRQQLARHKDKHLKKPNT